MRPQHPRRRRPTIEGLEPREVLSAMVPASIDQQTLGTPFQPGFLQGVADVLYRPNVPPGTPTAAEVRHQAFTARWIGNYTIGPPRFSGRADTIFLYGVSGGSNQFLKGKFEISLYPPSDPNATPTPGDVFANQVTGVASLFAQNLLQSSTNLVLDLNGTPAPGSSPGALPTRLNWAYDANTSAGAYTAPGGIIPGTGFTQGAGVVLFHWIPNARPTPGTLGSGRVIVSFEGLIHASGITNPIAPVIS